MGEDVDLEEEDGFFGRVGEGRGRMREKDILPRFPRFVSLIEMISNPSLREALTFWGGERMGWWWWWWGKS